MKKISFRKYIAYHESGHAIMALYHGIKFVHISIKSEKYKKIISGGRVTLDMSRLSLNKQIEILLAGHVSTRILKRLKINVPICELNDKELTHIALDLKTIIDLYKRLGKKDFNKFMESKLLKTEKILRKNWDGVVFTVKQLLKDNEIIYDYDNL